MKQADWQKVYAPDEAMLECRVKNTLAALSQEPERSMSMKRVFAVALVAVLALISVVALAAGLVFSEKADVVAVARQALREQYGFTPEMETFFRTDVQEDGKTVVFTGFDTGFDERIGVYTVMVDGGDAAASWSYDGEVIGEDTTSAIWDTALLAKAMARKAAGETWAEIEYPPEVLVENISEAEAVAIARQTIEAQYGAGALEGFDELEAHIFYGDAEAALAAGHGIKRYLVRLMNGENPELYECYQVKLYADDGEVIEHKYTSETLVPVEDPEGELSPLPEEEDASTREAKARAKFAPDEAIAMAKDAAASAYGLTQAQREKLDWVEEHANEMYAMEGDTPMIHVWLWLWQEQGDNAPFTEGDGLYTVKLNAETGVIEGVWYDSTLSGNG